jgi:uncharacterized protein RhaS with RHS repeats
MQQRYYDPGIGRFLSTDPVTANSVTGANFNRYWYANNNPYSFIDPDGRAPRNKGDPPGLPCPTVASCERERRHKKNEERKKEKQDLIRQLVAVTVDGPTRNENGAVRWEVRWDLSRPSEVGGWVVQQMQISSGGTYVSGVEEENPGGPYWEAWRVEPGQSSATGTDTIRRGPVDTSLIRNMYMKWNGSARYYEGLILPATFVWGQVREAGSMMSTYDDPRLPADNATEPVIRSFEMKFP